VRYPHRGGKRGARRPGVTVGPQTSSWNRAASGARSHRPKHAARQTESVIGSAQGDPSAAIRRTALETQLQQTGSEKDQRSIGVGLMPERIVDAGRLHGVRVLGTGASVALTFGFSGRGQIARMAFTGRGPGVLGIAGWANHGGPRVKYYVESRGKGSSQEIQNFAASYNKKRWRWAGNPKRAFHRRFVCRTTGLPASIRTVRQWGVCPRS
jgi:hypothetical protein